MLSPHVTVQPTPLSRLSVLGMAHTRAELERLLPPGHGWQPTEVDNHGHDAGRHPACLVRPAALVQAWHDEAQATGRLQTRWRVQVGGMQAVANRWHLMSPEGTVLADADWVFVAAAFGSLPLLCVPWGLAADDLPLRPVKGQLSFGPLDGPPDAERPQRRDGVYVPCYQEHAMPHLWAMGSTYERGADNSDVTDAAHERNLASLTALHPAAAERMRAQAANGQLRGWAGVRCASLDRLPLAGRLPDAVATGALLGQPPFHRRKPRLDELPRLPGLFTLCALGSRGLTLASLCADALVAEATGQATAIEAELWSTLDPARFLWRRLKRQAHA
jgi:tRNA 5-methylaminomethyl-2-thiouridine biosynthesis bifunctional protein